VCRNGRAQLQLRKSSLVTDFRYLQHRRDGAVEYLMLNRPEVRNALDEHLIAELAAWAAGAARDEKLRAVVLSGAGPSFCAGADLAWMSKMVHYTHDDNVRDATEAAKMFSAIDRLPVPVIARIHGAALGGGAGLAAVADIAVADETATFGFTEVRLGLLPAIIAPYVLAKIGQSAARELFLTGSRFTAGRAREIGLVHAVSPADRLDQTVQEYVNDILASGREAIAAAKALIRRLSHGSTEDVTAITADAIARQRVSAEAQERMKGFLKK
jgi:methylglutaconyl-CoA hydratase